MLNQVRYMNPLELPFNTSTTADDVNNSVADDSACIVSDGNNLNQVDTEIDESKSGEPWVQGFSEGEYSELTVEERLNTLVALVGISIEGNHIRSILENRLDAANALKKQKWAEAQLDKKRVKEETKTKFHSSFTGNEAKIDPSRSAMGTPSAAAANGTCGLPLDNLLKQLSLGPDNMQDHLSGILPPKILTVTDDSIGRARLSRQNEYASEKSRLQMKSYIGHKAEETYVYRSLPLGQDLRNRYWQFVACSFRVKRLPMNKIVVSLDYGCGCCGC